MTPTSLNHLGKAKSQQPITVILMACFFFFLILLLFFKRKVLPVIYIGKCQRDL